MRITITRSDLAFLASLARDKGDSNPTAQGDQADIIRAQDLAEGLTMALDHDIPIFLEER